MRQLLFASCALLSVNAFAHQNECSMDMLLDVHLDPTSIELLDDGQTAVTMTTNSLMIHGETVPLNSSQQAIYQDYQQEIREFVPEVVELAIDAAEIAVVAVNEVVIGLGVDSDGQKELEESVKMLRKALEKYFSKEEQTYHLAAHEEGEFDKELEEGIERVVESSIQHGLGSVFSLLAEVFKSDEGSFEQRMEAFGERMELMGDAIDEKVGQSSESFEKRGEAVCHQAEQLHKLELKVHKQIPELKDYDLLKI